MNHSGSDTGSKHIK